MAGNEVPDYVMPCLECQGGLSHLRFLNYFAWHQDELIAVPDFPMWVCDICGWRECDPRALAWLETLLNPPERRSRRRRYLPAKGSGGPARSQPSGTE